MGDRNSSAIAAASLLGALAAPPATPLVWLLSLATQPVCAQAVAAPPTATASVGSATAADSPVIDDIKFVGNTRVSVAQLRDVLKLKVGDIFSRAKMKADLNRIITLYRTKGYDLSVSPDIAHPAVGHVTITIKLDESDPGDARTTPPADATNTEPGGPPR